jgi:hypothetical protein
MVSFTKFGTSSFSSCALVLLCSCPSLSTPDLTSAYSIGYQYAVFYDAETSANESVRFVSVARRALGAGAEKSGEWEKFVLRDYSQTEDDGHNV